ncbi:IS4 family transposase [Azohydromonas australica]|uniref:IS4 family transposase n=1 Tax=Azohydromonas australica TaxID=364039 RepID=UPI001EE3CF4F|nr:IS4 family transposase [Azohydromonas australica]
MARCCTDDPAAAHVDEDHLTVLCAKRNVELQALTIQGYLREVARLGGFLARTHDGDPGWQTLWRGLTLLDAWVDGYQLAKKCG